MSAKQKELPTSVIASTSMSAESVIKPSQWTPVTNALAVPSRFDANFEESDR